MFNQVLNAPLDILNIKSNQKTLVVFLNILVSIPALDSKEISISVASIMWQCL